MGDRQSRRDRRDRSADRRKESRIDRDRDRRDRDKAKDRGRDRHRSRSRDRGRRERTDKAERRGGDTRNDDVQRRFNENPHVSAVAKGMHGNTSCVDTNEETEPEPIMEPIPGKHPWMKVTEGDKVYFFNEETQES